MTDKVTMWSIREGNTKGRIRECTGVINRKWFKPDHCQWMSWEVGADVFPTQAEAEAVARKNAAKRIASLEKSLAAMRKNPFAPNAEAFKLEASA